MKKTIEKYGACYALVLSVPSKKEVERLSKAVNRLSAWGIISNIPDDYSPKFDTAVMVLSDEKRFSAGLHSMAVQQMEQRFPGLAAKYKGVKGGGVYGRLVRNRYENLRASFVPVDRVYAPPSKDVNNYGQGQIHDFGWTQEFSTGA